MGSGSQTSAAVWQVVEVVSDCELADAIGSFLLEQGAPGLQTEERDSETTTTAHFAGASYDRSALDDFFRLLADSFPGSATPSVALSSIQASDWADNWRKHFPPIAVGAHLYIHPPWVDDVPPGRIAIELDPGMAFGTGQHGSTRGCLEALDELIDRRRAPRVLDLGTGSGVLSIAAIGLGARSVLAVDIDAEACAVAAANAEVNGVSSSIEVARTLEADRIGFDLIVANILSGVLIGMAHDIARRLAAGGVAIAGGFEPDESSAVAAAWQEAGLTRVAEYEVDGWSTLVFRVDR